MMHERVLVHLTSGIGNVMLATPLLLALGRRFEIIDLRLDADYPGVGELFRQWSGLRTVYDARAGERPVADYDIIVPAMPPYAWPAFAKPYRNHPAVMQRPPDALFYRDEQAYYLDFARRLGCPVEPRPFGFLPALPAQHPEIDVGTLVLAPGCKTGEMTAKRWPHFPRLAEAFDDVAVVGTPDDMRCHDGTMLAFPSHVRSLIGDLSLQELASVLATCGAVVANDSGIGHLAAVVGVATIMIFGPTPHATLGVFPPNVTILRSGLACEPCWFGARFAACNGRIDCLEVLSTSVVVDAVARHVGPLNGQANAGIDAV
jgi:ADP-heptose:LPS heptosyltransferase